jgi:hypothetical protein
MIKRQLKMAISFCLYIILASCESKMAKFEKEIAPVLDSEVTKIDQDFLDVESKATKLAEATAKIYSALESKVTIAPSYKLMPNGVYYSPAYGSIKSEVWVSGIVPVDEKLKKISFRSEQIDPLLVESVGGAIVQSYYNSKESLNRIYPPVGALTQYEAKMDITKFNFYNEADLSHNPTKKTVWVADPYVDPAGRGWMTSAISPVYVNDVLEGVVGLDVTIEEIAKKYIDPSKHSVFLMQENGMVIAAKNDIGQVLHLPEFKNYSYFETIKSDTFKPEYFNLSNSKNGKIRNLVKNLKTGKVVKIEIDEVEYFVIARQIPSIKWYMVIMK